MALGKIFRSYVDYSNERSAVRVNVPLYTVDNIVAQNTLVNNLWIATDGISICESDGYGWGNRYPLVQIPVASAFAQRETKWLVTYRDTTTGKRYRLEVPGADLDLSSDGKTLPIDAGAGLAWVTAFEALALTEDENAVEVIEIYHVGRNI